MIRSALKRGGSGRRRANEPGTLLSRLLRGVTRPPTIDRESALRGTERLSALHTLVAATEYLRGASALGPGELNDPAVRQYGYTPRARPWYGVVASPHGSSAVNTARLAAAAALLLPTGRRARLAANATLFAAAVTTARIESHGTDGSDQVAMLAHGATTVARGVRDTGAADAALWFLSLQSVLSYGAAGLAKLASRTWTSGEAMPLIFRTRAYGYEPLWRLANRRSAISKALAYGTIAFECLMPLVLLGRGRLTRSFVATSGAFHAGTAVTMGLGRFFTAFPVLHPAVAYTTRPAASFDPEDRRSAAMPMAATALATGVWAWSASRARRTVPLPVGESESVWTTPDGRRVHYTLSGSTEPGVPLVVCEGGLGEGAAYFEHVAAELGQDFAVLRYSRAGYQDSTRAHARDLDGARADIAALVEHVRPSSGTHDLILLGHSLGGYLTVTAAKTLRDRAILLVVLDPSHAAYFEQRLPGVPDPGRMIAIMNASLRVGLGGLLRPPAELELLPEPARQAVVASYCDARTWRTMRAEYAAASAEWRRGSSSLPGVPTLVVSAGRTATLDSRQSELDVTLAEQTGGRRVVIPGASHDGLIANAAHVASMAAQLRAALGLPAVARSSANGVGEGKRA